MLLRASGLLWQEGACCWGERAAWCQEPAGESGKPEMAAEGGRLKL